MIMQTLIADRSHDSAAFRQALSIGSSSEYAYEERTVILEYHCGLRGECEAQVNGSDACCTVEIPRIFGPVFGEMPQRIRQERRRLRAEISSPSAEPSRQYSQALLRSRGTPRPLPYITPILV